MTTMTTPEAVESVAPAQFTPGVEASAAAQRFTDELVRFHAEARYPGIVQAIEGRPLLLLDNYDDGLTTFGVRESQLPERYVRAIMGFRLAQFLQVGWMDPILAYERELSHEPLVPPAGPETIHTVTLTETGAIVGYIGFVGAPDASPMPLDTPARALFPVEAAHNVELLSPFAAPGRTTHSVWEIKRFARSRSMPRGAQRDRVPWHLILALGRIAIAIGDEAQVILGDSGDRGALRHLRLVGFELVVVEDTDPWLPRTELMWPSYQVPKAQRSKPFVGEIPADVGDYMDAIELGLVEDRCADWQKKAIARLVQLHQAAGRIPKEDA